MFENVVKITLRLIERMDPEKGMSPCEQPLERKLSGIGERKKADWRNVICYATADL